MAVVLVTAALGVVVAIVVVAGKTAIDPSFSPPILSGTSASLDVEEPSMGRALVLNRAGEARGYLLKADLEVEGLRGDDLIPVWSIQAVRGTPAVAEGELIMGEALTPDSNRDQRDLRQWIPVPSRMGRYVAEVRLHTLDGRTVADDRSAPFFAIGEACCRRYETDLYVAPLPRGWGLREDFKPYPEERFVTLAIGPLENSLVIDTSVIDPENIGKSALPLQAKAERGLAESNLGYSRISKRTFRAADGEWVVEWSYRLEGDAFTNILFFRGPSGFAVLGRSEDRHFRETRDLTRLVARSLVAKPVEDEAAEGG